MRRTWIGRLAPLALAMLGGCDREARQSPVQALPETASLPGTTNFEAGPNPAEGPDPCRQHYVENAFHISEGQRLHEDFNCSGFHAKGGGDIGPPFLDEDWIYGGAPEQIVATLVQGRPNGMPSFANRATEQQMWQLAAYVLSLSGNVPQDATSSRGDDQSSGEPTTLTEERSQSPVAPQPGRPDR